MQGGEISAPEDYMRWSRFFIPPLVAILFAGGWLATAGADPPQGKSTICHVAGNKVVAISVSNSAVPAHMEHGDSMPDEYGDCT